MRIGIDVDDTITETWQTIKPYFSKHFNVDLETLDRYPYSMGLNCNIEEYYSFYKSSIQQYMPFVPLKKDVSKYISELRKKGHIIYFITARSELDMDNPYQITRDYLDKYNIEYDDILVGCSSKDETATKYKIDLFIDDSIRNCTKVSNAGINSILFSTIYNKDCNDFKRVNDWKELYNLIEG